MIHQYSIEKGLGKISKQIIIVKSKDLPLHLGHLT